MKGALAAVVVFLGLIGLTVPTVAASATGSYGPTGGTGPTGGYGPTGGTGPTGILGPTGGDGPTGCDGPAGATYCWRGPIFHKHPRGPRGPIGDCVANDLCAVEAVAFSMSAEGHARHGPGRTATSHPSTDGSMSVAAGNNPILASTTSKSTHISAAWWFTIGALTALALIAAPRVMRRKADR